VPFNAYPDYREQEQIVLWPFLAIMAASDRLRKPTAEEIMASRHEMPAIP
jgi:hypothetical protein